MLSSTLGSSRLLARPGTGRLWVLNPTAAVLWDLHAAGFDAAAMAELLTQRFGLDAATAQRQVGTLLADWREAGLTAPLPPWSAMPQRPCADLAGRPTPAPAGSWCLRVAATRVSLGIADATLLAAMAPVVQPLRADPADAVDYRLRLVGNVVQWRLRLDGVCCAAGAGADAATVETVQALVELGCRLRERLLIAHGGGLVAADGRGLLLIAPGGAGKSTLAAALNAAGLTLLGDDVVPVTPDGHLVGLGMPLCLKAGSWPVLAECRPELTALPTVRRFGQAVRYLPPRGPRAATPVPTGWLLFPRYQPGTAPGLQALSPAAALEGVAAAAAVIRDLTQAKLEQLARWVGAAPAYALTYPDLDSGVSLVRDLLNAAL